MKNLLNEFIKLLEKNKSKFVKDGKIFKNLLVEANYKNDEELINILLSNEDLKNHFFFKVSDILIFDKEKFQKFISNKNFLPDSYTAFSNKIGLINDDEFIKNKKEVILSFPYKDCILEGGQTKEEEKRGEIFFNTTLAPDDITRLLDKKVLTNFKRYTSNGIEKVSEIKRNENGTIKENLIIKGNNLLALHSLKKEFGGKVKLIYIDPPYNTGNDSFKYNDNFNHSSWLVFMKNRLEVAKELLAEDGLIFINIDDREYHYLKVLCDEIFNRKNKISSIVLKVKDVAGVGQQSLIFDVTENLLVYSKNAEKIRNTLKNIPELTPLIDEKSIKGYNNFIRNYGKPNLLKTINRSGVGKIKIYECLETDIEKTNGLSFKEYMKHRKNIAADYNPSGGMILAIKKDIPKKGLSFIEYTPIRGKHKNKTTKVFFKNQRILAFLDDIVEKKENFFFRKSKMSNLWFISNSSLHLEGGIELKYGKKPENLLKRIIQFATKEGDLVLDYNIGSGTTCAVAHKMGRQYIGIEQLCYGKNDSVVRLQNVIGKVKRNGLIDEYEDYDKTGISKLVNWSGGGDFIYLELKKWNEGFSNKIKKTNSKEELNELWNKIQDTAFLSWRFEPSKFQENIKEFEGLEFENQKRFLIDILDKNHLYVNLTEIKDKTYNISEEDKKLNNEFYKK